MTKQLPNDRLKISQDFYSLSIEIPSKKNWLTLTFMLVWLLGWGVGEFFAIREVFNSDTNMAATIFLFIWLIGWSVGGAVVFYVIVWQLIGREIIHIERGVLKLQKSIIGFGRTRKFEIASIKNIEVVGYPAGRKKDHKKMLRKHWVKIRFDYKMKSVALAKNIHEAEAQMILEKLRENTHFNKNNFAQES